MRIILLSLVVLLSASCKNDLSYEGQPPQNKTCGFLTAKYRFNGVKPYFEIGEGQARIQVSHPITTLIMSVPGIAIE